MQLYLALGEFSNLNGLNMFEVQIAAVRSAADDIVDIELVPLAGSQLPRFEAGSHIDVQVAPGLVRQYSLHNSPEETHRYCIAVLKDPSSRGGSAAVHRDFHAGNVISIAAPRNNFRLEETAEETILIAGGIGITPLLSMAEVEARRGKRFALHYFARSENRAAFVERLSSLPLGASTRFHFGTDVPKVIETLKTILGKRKAASHVYICGPEGFIDTVRETALAEGMDSSQVHVEHFGAAISIEGGMFTVVARRSGIEVVVGETQTIAECLAAQGIAVPLSCEQGVCGTCLTPVIEGTPDHRDLYLSNSEKAANNAITVCCSRSCTPRLVLDI